MIENFIPIFNLRGWVEPMTKNVITLLRELFTGNGLEKYNLQISDDQGLVHLSGTVETWEQVVTAGHLAAGIRGVRGVVNEIIAARGGPLPYAAPAVSYTHLDVYKRQLLAVSQSFKAIAFVSETSEAI